MSRETRGKEKEEENKFEGNNLNLESSTAALSGFGDSIQGRLRNAGWNEKEVGQFNLAIDEAVANAIVHGNKGDKNKRVKIEIIPAHDHMMVTVEDEGDGFEESTVPPPTKDENLLKENGRGLFLMRQYSDDFQLLEGGRKVVLVKRRNNPEENEKTAQ